MTREVSGSVALIVGEDECGVCRRLEQKIPADEAWAEGFAIACRTTGGGGVTSLCQRHDDMTARKLRGLGMTGVVMPNDTSRSH